MSQFFLFLDQEKKSFMGVDYVGKEWDNGTVSYISGVWCSMHMSKQQKKEKKEKVVALPKK